MALTINTNRSQKSGSKISVPRASIEKIQTTGFDVSEFDHLRDADRTIEEPELGSGAKSDNLPR